MTPVCIDTDGGVMREIKKSAHFDDVGVAATQINKKHLTNKKQIFFFKRNKKEGEMFLVLATKDRICISCNCWHENPER